MKISYVTLYNALDVHNWSGLGYNIARALEQQQAELDYIGNLKDRTGVHVRFKKLVWKGLGKMTMGDRTPFLASHYAKQAEKRIKPDTDIIFSPGSLSVAMMKGKIPKVFYTDATFAGMLSFYEDYTRFSKHEVKVCNELEQRALDNCELAIYSSEWAAKTAIENYAVNPDKVKVVPFGANLNNQRRSIDDIKSLVRKRSRSKCKLLWLGVDWKRKGGDMALKVAECLNEAGTATELHVAGIDHIPLPNIPYFVKKHGFLSKATAAGMAKIEELMADSHFLILPSRAEAYGVVFCEAASLGLPSLATNVGGIPTAITDGINGQTFPVTALPEEYANFISTYYQDFSKYEKLAYSSFCQFQSCLNWNVAGNSIMNLLKNLVPRKR